MVGGGKYSAEDLKKLSIINSAMVSRCVAHKELSIWKRVKLHLAYRVWKRMLFDIEDELKKL